MQDIGQLGPKEGTAVVYNWKWHYSTPGLALWVVLVLAIVLVKGNRNPRALLILVPLLILNLLWFGFKKAIPLPSSATAMFEQAFASLTVGISVLWLLAHKLGNRNWFVTFLLALVIMATLCIVGAVSYSGLAFSEYTIGSGVIFGVLTLVMLFAFALAGWRCRKRYSNLRFMLWLGVWTIATSIVIMLVWVGIALVFMGIGGELRGMWISMLLVVFVSGPVFGGCLYAIVFPYMILALRSSFFRQRFYACLRLKSMPITGSSEADADRLGEQSTYPETSENGNSA